MNTRAPSEVLALYAPESPAVRRHVRIRWRTSPFSEVAARVPRRGQILDFGCGHGAFSCALAMAEKSRSVLGVDVAEDKIAAAKRAADAARTRGVSFPEFRGVSPGEFPEGRWDTVLFVDVLYLLTPGRQEAVLRAAARSLVPGGGLLVKETAERPRWKWLWNLVQETLAVRVLRITAGEGLHWVSPSQHRGWLESEGLEVESFPVDRGYLHPHSLLVATRPREYA